MNIFYVDNCPVKSANALHNKHIVKMVLESAQMLCTSHRILDGILRIGLSKNNRTIKIYEHPEYNDIFYKATHVNHPCNVWIRETTSNYQWLYDHYVALCSEYTKRYNKIHMTDSKLTDILKKHPKNLKVGNLTKPSLAMPDEYKTENSVESYRKYYNEEKVKKQSAVWFNSKPSWIINTIER